MCNMPDRSAGPPEIMRFTTSDLPFGSGLKATPIPQVLDVPPSLSRSGFGNVELSLGSLSLRVQHVKNVFIFPGDRGS